MDTDHLSNLSADLLSLRRLEPGLVHLFDRPSGEWVPVAELFALAGADASEVPADLSAAWLSAGGSGYAVVSFYADECKWSTSAVYNVARLMKARQPAAV